MTTDDQSLTVSPCLAGMSQAQLLSEAHRMRELLIKANEATNREAPKDALMHALLDIAEYLNQ